MSIFISADELEIIRQSVMQPGYDNLYRGIIERVEKYIASPGLSGLGTTTEWWHNCCECLTETAFVCVVQRNSDSAKKWLHDVVMSIARCSGADWIGPKFRNHTAQPPGGNLETAHLAAGVAIAFDLLPEIFSPEETVEITNALREKAIPLCQVKLKQANYLTNWTSILLAGMSVAAAVVDDREALAYAVQKYTLCLDSIQPDGSYGESFQYANYCTFGLMLTREALARSKAAPEEILTIEPYARLVNWYVHNYLYNKPMSGWGEYPRPRFVNFNDSSAICGPDPDGLMHISAIVKDSLPEIAGLARWMFDQFYIENPSQGPFDRNSFGFLNRYGLFTLLYYPRAAAALSPEQLNIPDFACFSNGDCVNRNSWSSGRTILAFHGAPGPLHDVGHHHEDLNSVILVHNRERLLVDPGHCCYRSGVHKLNVKTSSHNTCTFILKKDSYGNPARELEQTTCRPRRVLEGSLSVEPPVTGLSHSLLADKIDDVCVFAADAAKAYGSPIEKFERFCIMAGEHAIFFVDRIDSAETVATRWYWLLNNRDGQLEHKTAYKDRLVARRGNAGMKFFHLGNGKLSGPGYAYVHDAYHPLPNQLGENVAGSGIMYNWTEPETSGFRIVAHAATVDSYGASAGWHLKKESDKLFSLEGHQRWCNWQIQLDDNKITLIETVADRGYVIAPDSAGTWKLKKVK